MTAVAQAHSVEEACYIFAGSEKYGLTCDGCKYKEYCDDLANTWPQKEAVAEWRAMR